MKETSQNTGVRKTVRLVPPDGGWGWMIVAGTAICNVFNQSMLSLFGLLYGDALEAMGHRTSGAAGVLSAMLFATNVGGPAAGAVLRLTSARCVAVAGACLCAVGMLLSGYSRNIWHLLFSYGIVFGLGLGFIQNSTFVAINTYFKLRKSRAVGLANVGTGVGQTLMPHLVRYLLESYGFRGACMILSSLSLHGICGTLLIQPVEWHMKKIEEEIIVDEKLSLLEGKTRDSFMHNYSHNNNINNNMVKLNELTKSGKTSSDYNNKVIEDNFDVNKNGNKTNNLVNDEKADIKESSTLSKLAEWFALPLLKSPRFVNIVIGIALSVTSIQNFSMLFPLFLQKAAMMDKQQTATCMSASAGADIAGRLVLPYFQDRYRIKARWMLVVTCVWLIITRQVLAYQREMGPILVSSCLYGFGRSMIIVARNIAISENCRPEQVPAAVGLGMLTMGVIVPPTGYFLGWIRDYTGSYTACITAQNMLLVIILVTWLPDLLLLWIQEKRRKGKTVNCNSP